MKYEIDFESLRVSTYIYFTDLPLNELLSFLYNFPTLSKHSRKEV